MLQWSDSFLIGNERIDFEHRTFFGLVADFQKARLAGSDKATLATMLQEIALYAKFHFRSEENVMERMNYPELEQHRQEHFNLIEVLTNKMMGLDMGIFTVEEIEGFLVSWFIEHTSGTDKRIADYQRQHHLIAQEGPE